MKQEIYTANFNKKLKQAFKKYIALNAEKPTVEGLTQEVMSIYEEYCKQVGLPLYKHSDDIQVPQILRDQFLMDDKLALKIAADAQAVMDALQKDSELKKLLTYASIARSTSPFRAITQYYYYNKAEKGDYQFDLLNMVRASENDLIAKFYISSLKESKEYKALNHFVKGAFGEDKNLEDITIKQLEARIQRGHNDAFDKAWGNYIKVELATKICIQKAKVMSKELDSNPEEKARYEKYLLSDAHKKHMQEFEKVRGMSYVEHEALTLKALENIVSLDTLIKKQVTEFVDTIGKEDINSKAKNEAVKISHSRTRGYALNTVASMGLVAALALAPLMITGIAFPPILPIVACVTVMALAVTGIIGVVAHEVRKDPEKYKKTAIENTLKSVASNNTVYSEGLDKIVSSAASVVSSMQALESKQTKTAGRGA
jgi:hypothetical protein